MKTLEVKIFKISLLFKLLLFYRNNINFSNLTNFLTDSQFQNINYNYNPCLPKSGIFISFNLRQNLIN